VVTSFLSSKVFSGPGAFRMIPTRANGQLAVAGYYRQGDGAYEAHAVQVLTIGRGGISYIVSFNQPSLFASFGLPATLDPARVPVA
jgi:RNA polymerase sigma-70 factor (ECF subfamily)